MLHLFLISLLRGFFRILEPLDFFDLLRHMSKKMDQSLNTFDDAFKCGEKEIHSLKLTANAPENRPTPKRKGIVFQASMFSCDLLVSGEGRWCFLFLPPTMNWNISTILKHHVILNTTYIFLGGVFYLPPICLKKHDTTCAKWIISTRMRENNTSIQYTVLIVMFNGFCS